MMQRKSPVVALAVLAALVLLGGCEKWMHRPSSDPSTLKAIKAEALMLMKAYPPSADEYVPKSRWPRVIASLKPHSVLIYRDGVEVTTIPYFDGGWGYFVPRKERQLPEPVGRFEEAGEGVYWWHPY